MPDVQIACGPIKDDLRDSGLTWRYPVTKYLSFHYISVLCGHRCLPRIYIDLLIGGTELRTDIFAYGAIQAPEEFLC